MFEGRVGVLVNTVGWGRRAALIWAMALPLLLGSQKHAVGQEPGRLEAKEVYTSSSMEIDSYALSPDGNWIAFRGHPSLDRSSLYVVPANGGDPIQITHGAFHDHWPAWSPDSRNLFFISDRTEGPESGIFHLMRMPFDPDVGRAAAIPRPVSMEGMKGSVGSPAVSPDGKWVAYVGRTEGPPPTGAVRVVPSLGGPSRELARIHSGGVAWSEDNQSVLYREISRRDGNRGLYRVPLEGGNSELIFPIETGNWVRAVSGDGRLLLWDRRVEAGFPDPQTKMVTDFEGNVVFSFLGEPRNGPFSFDGSSLLYWRDRQADALVVIPLSGGPSRVVKEDACINQPLGWTKGEVVLFLEYCPSPERSGNGLGSMIPRAFLLDASDGGLTPISHFSEKQLHEAYGWAIHPDGRHVLVELPRDPFGSSRETSHMIVDLETGSVQDLSTNPGFADIYGNDGQATFGEPTRLLGDRFLLIHEEGENIVLLTAYPGEEPRHFWTYPTELVRKVGGWGGIISIHGDQVAWVRADSSAHPAAEVRSSLMISNVVTGTTREAVTMQGELVAPRWSRSGNRIALEYSPAEGGNTLFAIVDLSQPQAHESPLVLDSGGRGTTLGGWTSGDEHLFFRGDGVEGRNRTSLFLFPVAQGGVPVDLTPDDPNPFAPGLLSLDGTSLVYPSRRLIGNTILKYDLPPTTGGPVR